MRCRMVRTCVLSRTGGEASHVLTVSLTYVLTYLPRYRTVSLTFAPPRTYVPFHPRTYVHTYVPYVPFHPRTYVLTHVRTYVLTYLRTSLHTYARHVRTVSPTYVRAALVSFTYARRFNCCFPRDGRVGGEGRRFGWPSRGQQPAGYPISEITPSLVVTYVRTFNQTHWETEGPDSRGCGNSE